MAEDTVIETATGTLRTRGIDCALHTWNVPTADESSAASASKPPPPKGIAIVYHGLLAHGRYPTVRYAAELLAKSGFAVFALDLPGHGISPGERGYIKSAGSLIQDGVAVAVHAHDVYYKLYHTKNAGDGAPEPVPPLFLIGSSMGGAIALSVCRELEDADPAVKVRGVVLLAPMLAVGVSEPIRYFLRGLSYILPSAALIGSTASSSADQYRDSAKREECDNDELTVKGKLRCASASSCVELASQIRENFGLVKCPFLCMVANEDRVVNNDGCLELMDQAASTDKTLKRYDALHGLLCEPEPLLGEIHGDILQWLSDRIGS